MVKGINRQVLEIRETGSKYFERAFFFVNPQYAETSEQKLRAEAADAIGAVKKVPEKKQKKRKYIFLWILSSFTAAIGGALGMAIILH